MKYRIDLTINNNEPIYEFYKSGHMNPLKWIWFPQYKVGSRTIETHINKTLCAEHWRREGKPEVGYVKYMNVPFSENQIEFKSIKPMYEKMGWRTKGWTELNPLCKTPKAFSESDPPSDYFKFMFTRNPWDRAVSCWNDKRYDGGKKEGSPQSKFTFNQYVDWLLKTTEKKYNGDISLFGNPHVRSQYGMIYEINLDYIGKLETFHQDWSNICNKLGVEMFKNEIHQNKTQRTHYRDYYNDRTKGAIAELYKKDIDKFDYAF